MPRGVATRGEQCLGGTAWYAFRANVAPSKLPSQNQLEQIRRLIK